MKLDEALVPSPARGADLAALDEALAAFDPRTAGWTPEETAEVLQVSADTVYRDWRLAKVWLCRELKAGAST